MRIHSITPRWPTVLVAVAACLYRIDVAKAIDDGGIQGAHAGIITFTDASFTGSDGTNAALFSVADMTMLQVEKTFEMTFENPVQISNVFLYDKSMTLVTQASPNNTYSNLPATAVNEGVKTTNPRATGFTMEVSVFPANKNGYIYIPDLRLIGDSEYDTPLFFRVQWNETGYSYSRQFAITKEDKDSEEYDKIKVAFESDEPAGTEQLPTSNTQTASIIRPSSTSGAGTATTTVVAVTATSTSNPMASNSKKSGGLSTGAIAGIAVACGVIGLALIGFAIWFFCFRRRRGDGVSAAPYGSDRHHRTQELIAEKEANAGVTESPHSPYSDDGQNQHAVGGMNGSIAMDQPTSARDSTHFAGAAAPIMAPSPHPHSIDRSYTPYSDHRGSGVVGTPETQQSQPVHYDQPERGAPSPQVASQPTTVATRSVSPQQGIAGGRYAHLVEEGMTEDEIRRLEEEERQLDAAIADREAGRGR